MILTLDANCPHAKIYFQKNICYDFRWQIFHCILWLKYWPCSGKIWHKDSNIPNTETTQKTEHEKKCNNNDNNCNAVTGWWVTMRKEILFGTWNQLTAQRSDILPVASHKYVTVHTQKNRFDIVIKSSFISLFAFRWSPFWWWCWRRERRCATLTRYLTANSFPPLPHYFRGLFHCFP